MTFNIYGGELKWLTDTNGRPYSCAPWQAQITFDNMCVYIFPQPPPPPPWCGSHSFSLPCTIGSLAGPDVLMTNWSLTPIHPPRLQAASIAAIAAAAATQPPKVRIHAGILPTSSIGGRPPLIASSSLSMSSA